MASASDDFRATYSLADTASAGVLPAFDAPIQRPAPRPPIANAPSGSGMDLLRRVEAALEPPAQPVEAGPKSLAAGPGPNDQEQITVQLPPGPTDAQIHEFGANFVSQFGNAESTSVLFTSPGPGSGTTTALLRLCMELVRRRAGEVVVLDCCFREPGLTRYLGLMDSPGITEALMQQKPWTELVLRTQLRGFNVLTCGRKRNVEVLHHLKAELASLISNLRRYYKLILLDAGHLGRPEVPILARLCDGCYVVVPLRQATPLTAGEAIETLQSSGARVLGAVLTAVK